MEPSVILIVCVTGDCWPRARRAASRSRRFASLDRSECDGRSGLALQLQIVCLSISDSTSDPTMGSSTEAAPPQKLKAPCEAEGALE